MARVITEVPRWAAEHTDEYPERIAIPKQCSLPFYCINCYRKAQTEYLTSNFGPFCADCLKEIAPLLRNRAQVVLIPISGEDRNRETFNDAQLAKAVRDFLQYGEQAKCPKPLEHDTTQCNRGYHHGYFSDGGWAARALRYLEGLLGERD